jgi:hypothetical protein
MIILGLLISSIIIPVTLSQSDASNYILMDSTQLSSQGNYPVGYVNVENTIACQRIGMFKFSALNTGIASSISFSKFSIKNTCNIDIGLYIFKSGLLIGTKFIGPVSEEIISLDVSNLNWVLNRGTTYYLSIQSNTLNQPGNYCTMNLTCGLDKIFPSQYSIVAQKGLVGQSCDTTLWTNRGVANGGYIRMKITGTILSVSSSRTSSPSPVTFYYSTLSPTTIRTSTIVPRPAVLPDTTFISYSPSASSTASSTASDSWFSYHSASSYHIPYTLGPLDTSAISDFKKSSSHVGSIEGSLGIGIILLLTISFLVGT